MLDWAVRGSRRVVVVVAWALGPPRPRIRTSDSRVSAAALTTADAIACLTRVTSDQAFCNVDLFQSSRRSSRSIALRPLSGIACACGPRTCSLACQSLCSELETGSRRRYFRWRRVRQRRIATERLSVERASLRWASVPDHIRVSHVFHGRGPVGASRIQ